MYNRCYMVLRTLPKRRLMIVSYGFPYVLPHISDTAPAARAPPPVATSAGPLGAQRQRIALGWRHFPEWGWWVDVAELHGIVIDGYTSAVLRTELSSPHTSSVCPCKRVQNLYTSTEHMDVRWLAKITLFADKPLGFVCCTACSCPCGTNINMTGDRSKMALAQV